MNTWTKAVSLSIKTAIGLVILMFFLVVIGIVFYVVSFAEFEGTITLSVESTITLGGSPLNKLYDTHIKSN